MELVPLTDGISSVLPSSTFKIDEYSFAWNKRILVIIPSAMHTKRIHSTSTIRFRFSFSLRAENTSACTIRYTAQTPNRNAQN